MFLKFTNIMIRLKTIPTLVVLALNIPNIATIKYTINRYIFFLDFFSVTIKLAIKTSIKQSITPEPKKEAPTPTILSSLK